jgi:ribonuclease-3
MKSRAKAARAREIAHLEAKIGHTFGDARLLLHALQHRSYVAEQPGVQSNERLEFLGDAVLGLIVTDTLFRRWPDLPEGALAKARAAVVNSEYLAGVAGELGLGSYIRLGKGEAASGGREKPSILADAMEAIIGALYLDGGFEVARSFVDRFVEDRLQDAVTGDGSKDFKTRLQEISAQRWAKLPVYSVDAFGPDHAKRFEARVMLNGKVAGTGRGRSKKQAEQAAARAAWENLGAMGDEDRGNVAAHPTQSELTGEPTDA